jgi:hypothetical protein
MENGFQPKILLDSAMRAAEIPAIFSSLKCSRHSVGEEDMHRDRALTAEMHADHREGALLLW